MKAYKLEVLVVDHDGLGADQIRQVIENQKYPNWCIYPDVKAIEGRDIGEWDDDHPLNKHATAQAEYERLFGDDDE